MIQRREPDLPPGTRVMGLEVVEWVGSGGFGTVYKARNADGLLFALKFIPTGAAKAWGLRELSNLLLLQHPNLVRMVAGSYWPDDRPEYVVLQLDFIAGQPLDEWAREENPDARGVVSVMLGVARGLGVAHAASVIHRDVKESNILVREDDGEAVLMDFGAAWCPGNFTLTEGLLPPGTRDYRAPEAWRFALENEDRPGAHYRPGRVDDLYALGVVLYRLLAGRSPFTSLAEREDLQAMLEQQPLPPHVVNPRVPVELGELCLRLLAKQPEARFPDAVELYRALDGLLKSADARWRVPLHDPPHARRSPPPPQAEAHPPPEALLLPHVSSHSAATLTTDGLPTRSMALRALRHTVAAAALLVACGGLAALLVSLAARPGPAPVASPMTPQEVARPENPPEAGPAAAPPVAISTSAASPQAAPSKDEAPVKTQKNGAPSKSQPARGLGLLGKALGIGSACTALAGCPGAQVRPPPPPEPCPAGALETMKALDIRVGAMAEGITFRTKIENASYLFRTEGWNTVLLTDELGKLPQNTLLSGRLIVGDRIYLRLTQAQIKDQSPIPICLDTFNLKAAPEPGKGANAIKVWSEADVRAVDRFE